MDLAGVVGLAEVVAEAQAEKDHQGEEDQGERSHQKLILIALG